jgi:polyvinyl alcohol dehydrogenase (cytochrome)
MTSARILRVMDFGAMMTVAYTLTRTEREAVANFIGTPGAEPEPAPAAFCANRTVSLPETPKAAWNGWSPSGDNARYVTAAQTSLTPSTIPRLKLKWAFGYSGVSAARAQPALAGGRLFVASENGEVHALDPKTGCTHWTFKAAAGVRTGLSVGPYKTASASGQAVYFGDTRATAYAVDAQTGAMLWTRTKCPVACADRMRAISSAKNLCMARWFSISGYRIASMSLSSSFRCSAA